MIQGFLAFPKAFEGRDLRTSEMAAALFENVFQDSLQYVVAAYQPEQGATEEIFQMHTCACEHPTARGRRIKRKTNDLLPGADSLDLLENRPRYFFSHSIVCDGDSQDLLEVLAGRNHGNAVL